MRNRFRKPAMLIALFMGAFLIMGVLAESAHAVPVFARKYGTSCNTCHISVPRLNAFGMAFKRNGYFWPGGDDAARKVKAVEMGNTHWGARSTIDESVPFAFWMTYTVLQFKPYGGDATYANGKTASKFDWGTAGVDVFSGGTFGDRIGFIFLVANFGVGTPEIEAGQFIFNDLGVENLINIRAGLLLGGPSQAQWHRYEAMSQNLHLRPVGATGPGTGLELYGFTGLASGGGFGYGVGIVNHLGTATDPGGTVTYTSATAGKTVWVYLEFQAMGMRLDGKGGAKHAQSWRDDHIRIRPYLIYGSQDGSANAHYRKLVFGAELEAWWSILQFKADWQINNWKKVYTNVTSKSHTIAAQIDLVLLNGTIIPGLRAEFELDKDASWVYGGSGVIHGLTQKRPAWLEAHIVTQLRSNLVLALVADINLSDVAASNPGGRSHTIDSIYLQIKTGW